MNELRISQRWMPLPWSVIGAVLGLIFGGIGAYSLIAYPDDDPSARLAIPLYGVAVYWVIALYWNKRTATITPLGVRVTTGPFPVRPARSATKEKIVFCFVYTVRIYDEGTELETYENVGVETVDGEQIVLSGPHLLAGEAMQAALQIARALTGVHVHEIDYEPRRGEAKMKLLLGGFWLAAAIAAIFLGVVWELR